MTCVILKSRGIADLRQFYIFKKTLTLGEPITPLNLSSYASVTEIYLLSIIIDFNLLSLIPNHFESKELMFYTALNCYEYSLKLEVNNKNKNTLNRRIGSVYSALISEYIVEITSEL